MYAKAPFLSLSFPPVLTSTAFLSLSKKIGQLSGKGNVAFLSWPCMAPWFFIFLSSYLLLISIFGFESQNTSAKSRICVLIQSKMLEKINTTQPYKSTLGPKIEKRIKATYQISCKWRTHFLKINKHWYGPYSAGSIRIHIGPHNLSVTSCETCVFCLTKVTFLDLLYNFYV